jgi:hypothetical protein
MLSPKTLLALAAALLAVPAADAAGPFGAGAAAGRAAVTRSTGGVVTKVTANSITVREQGVAVTPAHVVPPHVVGAHVVGAHVAGGFHPHLVAPHVVGPHVARAHVVGPRAHADVRTHTYRIGSGVTVRSASGSGFKTADLSAVRPGEVVQIGLAPRITGQKNATTLAVNRIDVLTPPPATRAAKCRTPNLSRLPHDRRCPQDRPPPAAPTSREGADVRGHRRRRRRVGRVPGGQDAGAAARRPGRAPAG